MNSSPIRRLPTEVLLNITDLLSKKSRTNFSMVMNLDLDAEYKTSGYDVVRCELQKMGFDKLCCEGGYKMFFGYKFCKNVCDECVRETDDGFCYLNMLTRRRLPVMMVLGAYPDAEKIKKLRAAMPNACLDDYHLSESFGGETLNGFADKALKDGDDNALYLCNPTLLHLSKNRYSYGEEDLVNPVFSVEEMNMFHGSNTYERFEGIRLDDEIEDYTNPYYSREHFKYYVLGSELSFKPKDFERDILSSGYSAVEEASIIANFKRRIDLGLPLEEAMKGSIGLDNWTIRRHGMSGVKRFIESRICDIARNYGKNPRRKLNQSQADLLKKADEMNLDNTLYDRNVTTPSLKNSISRSSLNTIKEDILKPIVSGKVKMAFNKNEIDPESMVSMSELGDIIADIGRKIGEDMDKIEDNNKIDSRLDDMLLKAEEVQSIYDGLKEQPNTKKDPFKLKKSIEDIHRIYDTLIDDEISSLEKYGKATEDLVAEYKKKQMFDESTKIMRNEQIIKDINELIEKTGEPPIQRCGGPVVLLESSDDSDISDIDGKYSFLFHQEEMERKNEEMIVDAVEKLMTSSLDKSKSEENDKYLNRTSCKNILFQNFGIKDMEEYHSMNRTKRELFRYLYRRINYLYGIKINFKESEDPKKAESYNKVFIRFYNEYIEGRTIVRDNPKDMRKFWKTIMGGNNRDKYCIPQSPEKYVFIYSKEKTEEINQLKTDNYNRKVKEYNESVKIEKDCLTRLEKVDIKLEKANRLNINDFIKMPAISKLKAERNSLIEKIKESKKCIKPSQPVFEDGYEKVVSEEWQRYNKLLVGGSRKDLIEAGWMNPKTDLSIQDICSKITRYLEEESIYERVRKVRFSFDRSNMIYETESNDFDFRVRVVESQVCDYDVDSFLLSTVTMFLHVLDNCSEISNHQYKLIKRSISGQETRVLCSLISYYCFGYISKNFLNLRKKHRRSICRSFDNYVEY